MSNFFSYIAWQEQVTSDEMIIYNDVRIALDQRTELDFYSASSLIQQSVDGPIAPLGHIILILIQPVFDLFP